MTGVIWLAWPVHAVCMGADSEAFQRPGRVVDAAARAGAAQFRSPYSTKRRHAPGLRARAGQRTTASSAHARSACRPDRHTTRGAAGARHFTTPPAARGSRAYGSARSVLLHREKAGGSPREMATVAVIRMATPAAPSTRVSARSPAPRAPCWSSPARTCSGEATEHTVAAQWFVPPVSLPLWGPAPRPSPKGSA